MKRFARVLAVLFGIVVLGSFVLLVPQKYATAQSGPTVTIANPLPLPVKGNVGISGNVPVVNPLDASGNATPIIARDADNAARQPFSAQCVLDPPNSATESAADCATDSNEITVPDGKRLVVEYVSAQLSPLSFTGVGKSVLFNIFYTSGNRTRRADFVPQQTGPLPGQGGASEGAGVVEVSVVSAVTRLYVDPGSKINCVAIPGSGSAFNSAARGGTCNISGYLVAP